MYGIVESLRIENLELDPPNLDPLLVQKCGEFLKVILMYLNWK